MKTVVRLSLVASMLFETSVVADTLEEALKASKVKGEIKTEYANSNFLGNTTSDSISAVGGSLNLVTGDYYGAKAGVTFQTSHILDTDNNNNVFANDLDAHGSVLSEAYVDYKVVNTNLKIGRYYMYTPLVSTAVEGKSSETLLKDSFEAYVLTNTDIAHTTLVAGYISKYQAQTNGRGDVGAFNTFQDGAYTLYAKNTSIDQLTLQAQYLDENGVTSAEDKNAFYLQADYVLAGHTLSMQYLRSHDKTQHDGAQDAELFGLKATGGLGIGKLGYVVAYTSSVDDGAVYTGAGEGTTDTLFTAMPVNGGGVAARANTETLVGGIIIPIVQDLTTIVYAGQSFCNDIGPGDFKAYGAVVIYPYNTNLLIKVNYEHVNVEHIFAENTEVARVYLSYKF